MADGYARVSGKPGVAFVITGPGLTNALTAMAQARADSVPMLVVSGVNRRASRWARGLGCLHELPDQAAMVRALCPTFPGGRARGPWPALDRAFAAMLGGRPRPGAYRGADRCDGPCPAAAGPAPPPAPARAGPRRRSQALLNGAAGPVILAGAARGGPMPAAALAEALDAPVVQTVNARG
jgi:acetolactate synthase I/II/III large subunit